MRYFIAVVNVEVSYCLKVGINGQDIILCITSMDNKSPHLLLL